MRYLNRQLETELHADLIRPCYSVLGGLAMLTGRSSIYSLSSIWQTNLALRGYQVHTIDCAMRFNSYAIADEALRNDIAPEVIADAISVSRAFTPYQILDAIYEILESSFSEKKLYFVLAPSKQFFDGDVAFDEGLFLLEKVGQVLAEIKKKKTTLLLVENESYSSPVFRTAYNNYFRLSDVVYKLSGDYAEGPTFQKSTSVKNMKSYRLNTVKKNEPFRVQIL